MKPSASCLSMPTTIAMKIRDGISNSMMLPLTWLRILFAELQVLEVFFLTIETKQKLLVLDLEFIKNMYNTQIIKTELQKNHYVHLIMC